MTKAGFRARGGWLAPRALTFPSIAQWFKTHSTLTVAGAALGFYQLPNSLAVASTLVPKISLDLGNISTTKTTYCGAICIIAPTDPWIGQVGGHRNRIG